MWCVHTLKVDFTVSSETSCVQRSNMKLQIFTYSCNFWMFVWLSFLIKTYQTHNISHSRIFTYQKTNGGDFKIRVWLWRGQRSGQNSKNCLSYLLIKSKTQQNVCFSLAPNFLWKAVWPAWVCKEKNVLKMFFVRSTGS